MKNFGSLVNSIDVVLKILIASVVTWFVQPPESGIVELYHLDFETFLFIYTSMWIGHVVYDLFIFLKENRKKM